MEKEIKQDVSKMNIYEKLSHIQNEMKAPKNLYNKFGKYNYRNAESIMEASKPICKKYRTVNVIFDRIKFVEGRFYVEAVAKLYDWDSDKAIEVTASAREVESQKGMDGAQVTGTASSYARKYALNGLFNLDDNKDADTDEYHIEKEERAKENKQQKTPQPAPQPQPKKHTDKEITDLLKVITNQRNELHDLGIDFRNPTYDKWIKEKCFIDDQNTDLVDFDKMQRLSKGYQALIDGKKQQNAKAK